jgi:UDP-N-acetylmuramoylalanine--D-glutamate ligase
MRDWKNCHALIIGAARQGLALARFLAGQGADVVINDIRPAADLQAALESMHGVPVKWQLGSHTVNLLDGIDVVCVSGGVPLSLPLVEEARKRNIPILNDSQIFMSHVSARVIGITGSAGKTTTTTLVGRMAEQAAQTPVKAWVGGNIGRPLIDVVDQIQADDLVVLEFSSFQLEIMEKSPAISAILNITPNHLDRHETMDRYTESKARIFQFQGPDDWTVLGSEDSGCWSLRDKVPGKLAAFGFAPSAGIPCAYIENEMISLFDGSKTAAIFPVDEIELRGDHNLLNVLAACAVAQAAGFSHQAMQAGLRGFKGVPHRLEYVRTFKGADWFNDSKATTPEGSAAAIRAFKQPLIVLLGGRDKHLPWDKLAAQVYSSVEHVIAFGEAASLVVDAIGEVKEGRCPLSIDRCETLALAVARAADLAQPGDVVLLAPGGTSFDEFNNFEERGDRYKEWVNKLS